MKYETEINSLLKELVPKEDWVTDKDFEELIDIALNTLGITKEKLSSDIEVGIKNGYPIEQQIKIIKSVLQNNNI